MDSLDSYFVIIGVIAIGVGFYELFTKKLVGRKLEGVKKESIRKFLPYDVATYIIDGISMVLLGGGSYIPFMKTTVGIFAVIILSLAVLYGNWYFSKKFLGTPVNPDRLR